MYCQVLYLRSCHPGRIRHALAELPETLDETYKRTLREVNKADWELAHWLFQVVAVASHPLRVEELVEFLAFDFNAGVVFPAHFSILSTPTQTHHLTAYLTDHLIRTPDLVPHDLGARDHSHDPVTRHPDSTIETRDQACDSSRDTM